MIPKTRSYTRLTALVAAIAALGCVDAPSSVLQPTAPGLDAVKFWETTASTTWNQRATALLVQRPPASRRRSHLLGRSSRSSAYVFGFIHFS